ncbi:DUF6266 family protein [Tenacibaculum adriaticum]|uniref:Uncharacterized protein n=1 Tax=Tenacibaculum adriaticum TaxID=413713 RepID=A0A5S5DR10_9FLAO|nr:DUF6266 family protein [Tenacibaculum adriaticum]MAL58605.1 hypothetical protein [Flavobacteriaceae bacterium]TYP98327.1 hypothetical protein C7447_103500 [Tenacibaculum adriaticum]|tara:strand:+ start:425 stop:1066 length:642 start_codon:yes stop_codon:yes gene_type:complete
MGKIPQGILGSLSGKVGSIIGGSWKGIDYIRIKPASVANPRTEGQVNQRNKFTITLEYLQATSDFIKVGYKAFAVKKTEFNAAMSYVLNNAVGGIAPNFTIDYSLALLSRGSLSSVLNGSTDLATPGQVTFDWDDNSAEGNANATDKAMVLVYNPSKKESVSILDGADRTVGSQVITIPNTYAGDTVELFMAFVSADGTQVSNSVYLGSGTAA